MANNANVISYGEFVFSKKNPGMWHNLTVEQKRSLVCIEQTIRLMYVRSLWFFTVMTRPSLVEHCIDVHTETFPVYDLLGVYCLDSIDLRGYAWNEELLRAHLTGRPRDKYLRGISYPTRLFEEVYLALTAVMTPMYRNDMRQLNILHHQCTHMVIPPDKSFSINAIHDSNQTALEEMIAKLI